MDQLHDELWSDRSELLNEIQELRVMNANLQDQLNHLPTEARLYRESVMKAISMDQDVICPWRLHERHLFLTWSVGTVS